MKKIAFLGLGTMGYPMAGHLQQKGFKTTAYNRTISKAEQWQQQYHGEIARTPAEAASSADVVLCCVGNDNDVAEVLLGENGALSTMRSGSILIDHTTTSVGLAERLNKQAQTHQLHFLDAPVSGGEQGAINGSLTIMCGGDTSTFNQSKNLLEVYGQKVALMGVAGCGQKTKMANQICVAGLLQGLSEAMYFAQKAELDVAAVIDVISKGAAQSWQMENRHHTMLAGEYNHGFAVDWMRKDLAHCLDYAKQIQAPLPITEIVDDYYAQIQEMGGNRWDTSSLFKRLQQLNNTKSPS